MIQTIWKDVVIVGVGSAIVYCAISFGGHLRHFKDSPPIQVGAPLAIPGESASTRRELIIFGSETCRYSRQSIDFDRRLIVSAAAIGIPVHVITPNASSAEWYSRQLTLPSSATSVLRLSSLGVRGTPTIVMRDEHGLIQGLWEGMLPPHEQEAVILRLRGKEHTLEPPHFEDVINASEVIGNEASSANAGSHGSVLHFDDKDLTELANNEKVLDLEERSSSGARNHRIEEINIPFPELDVRARIELDKHFPTIVDCSLIDVGTCDLAALKLVYLNFDKVSVLDRGFRGMACGITPAGE